MDNRKRGLLLAAIIGLGGLAFILDLLTPLGIVVWVLYLPVIAASALLEHPRYVMLTAAGCSVLTAAGFFLSPPGVPLAWGLINRGLGLAGIGLTALAGLAVGRRSVQLGEANAALQREIAERRRGAELLRTSEERFRVALRHSPIVVFNQDRDLRYTWICNPHGFTVGEVLGKTDADLLPVEEVSRLTALKRQVLETGLGARGELAVVRDGQTVFYNLSVEPLRDGSGQIIGITCAAMDITARRQAEEDLRRLNEHLGQQVAERTTHLEQANTLLRQEIEERHRAEQALRDREVRHRAILDTAVDAIITIDQRGIIESVNPAAERMFGYTAGEMVGRNVNMLMPSPHREQHDGYRARFLQTGVKRIIGIGREVQGLRKDGSLVPVDLAVSEINHLRIFAGILRDLTPRKELEKEVLEVATLEQQRIGQELHDGVGQELTALGLLAEGLVEALGEGPPAEARLVAKVAEGLKNVLGQVRALSRGLIPVEVDAAGLMAALAELAARTSQLQGVTCTFGCKEPVLVEDNQKATHLYRIAKEAVTNVLRHAQARHIAISLEDDGQSVVLRIQDDGVGFSPEPEATKGMGLKIMHYRAALINARLAVGPAEPVGTLVTCTLSKGTDHDQEQDQGK